MLKARALQPGDQVASISLSWGGAGDIPHRYQAGKRQLEETFGLKVIETTHALRPAEWIAQNPQARAEDLMEALSNPAIKAIISNIGGEDSIRTLPYVDLDIIRANPKIFLGFSDSTISHFCFYKAGVTSFYGPSIMTGFAENQGLHEYQIQDIRASLFSYQARGIIRPHQKGWTSEYLDWKKPENQSIVRELIPSTGWRFLQGSGKVRGQLLGGCLEVMDFLKDTPFWVKPEEWKGKLMFLETSEVKLLPDFIRWKLRNYATSGILHNIKGILLGRPYGNVYWQEYDQTFLQIIRDEQGLKDLPIVTGMDFGHTSPCFTLPYGVEAEIDCEQQTFAILENALIE
ncbi:MAG: S66 peptidase family protein [Bacteroidota bacterium]